MYTAPDFIKVELMVKSAFANGSGCPYDEGTNYTKTGGADICTEGNNYGTYIKKLPTHPYQCYSTLDE